MTGTKFNVIVVGAGHAGCEAALASARLGATTAIITPDRNAAARMSCNPSIGGIGKSHLVFELDALGGEMARNADYSGIQFRMLNTRKGPAVHGVRSQNDRIEYAYRMLRILNSTPNLSIIEAMVGELWVESGRLRGVILEDYTKLESEAVVLTPGTFLNGRIHIGKENWSGGRINESASYRMSSCLSKLGLTLHRLKTGTPARLSGKSLDYTRMIIQPGEVPAPLFSIECRRKQAMFHVEQPHLEAPKQAMFHVEQLSQEDRRFIESIHNQTPCYLTHTSKITHDIIRDNLAKSSLYGGQITGTGVRYCPSVEDKIVKFPQKESHHVFIEPEGRNSDSVYPNGISNSLPRDIQQDLIHSIPGLEKAEILEWAYAIEYDFADPTQLSHLLECHTLSNLYLAGQINGTTGYEEATVQGFVAGANAALKALDREPLILSRFESYAGIMIDDLVTKGVSDPYRMFTSRAENRLSLRQDNARYRMYDRAKQLAIADISSLEETARFRLLIEKEISRLEKSFYSGISAAQYLKQPGITYANIHNPDSSLPREVIAEVEIQLKYEGYISQENKRILDKSRLEQTKIPTDIDYWKLAPLRHEAREKFSRVRPSTLGQAGRIPGISPADLSVLNVLLKSMRAHKS